MTDRELERLVSEYRKRYLKRHCAGIEWHRTAPDLPEAIERACVGDEDGKVFSHQRRVGRVRLRRFAQALQSKRKAIANCRSFRELHDVIEGERIRGVGALTIYDVAERIGFCLRIEPEDVYLHAGATEGARALGLGGKGGLLSVVDLPRPLRGLPPFEVENFLCIFKGRLRGEPAPPVNDCGPGTGRKRRGSC